MKIRAMGTGLETDVEALGVFRPQPEEVPALSVGEVGSFWGNIKDLHSTRIGDTITEIRRPDRRAAAGLRRGQAHGLRRPLPDRRRRVREPARRDGEAAPERRVVLLRARELDRARLRLPLRLPRPAPHGDRPGAAGARVRPRPDHDGARRQLPGHDHEGRGPRDRQPEPPARPQLHRADRGALHHGDDHHARRLPRRAAQALRGAPRHPEVARVPRRQPRRPDLRLPPERGRPRLLRQAEVDLEGLRLLRLRVLGLPGGRPRQARPARQRRAGRRPVADRPPGGGRREGPASWRQR